MNTSRVRGLPATGEKADDQSEPNGSKLNPSSLATDRLNAILERLKSGPAKSKPARRKDPDLESLDFMCLCLNMGRVPYPVFGSSPWKIKKVEMLDFIGFKRELRAIVKSWQESGPNLEVWAARNPEIWDKIKHVSVQLIPTCTGTAKPDFLAVLPNEKAAQGAEFWKLSLFLMLVMCRHWDKLAGPCPRCDMFYVKKTKRQKVYCSKRCGLIETSVKANRRRRGKLHKQRLAAATRHIEKWLERPRRSDWKTWVSSQMGCTKHWLTRVFNRGELIVPKR